MSLVVTTALGSERGAAEVETPKSQQRILARHSQMGDATVSWLGRPRGSTAGSVDALPRPFLDVWSQRYVYAPVVRGWRIWRSIKDCQVDLLRQDQSLSKTQWREILGLQPHSAPIDEAAFSGRRVVVLPDGGRLVKGAQVDLGPLAEKKVRFGQFIPSKGVPQDVVVVRVKDSAELRHQTNVASLFNHPNLVPPPFVAFSRGVKDTAVWRRYPHTLDSWAQSVPLTKSAVGKVLLGVGAGLTEMHARGVLHGKLHPGTVFVDAKGNAVLGGFGRSERVDVLQTRHAEIVREVAAECGVTDLMLDPRYRGCFFYHDDELHSKQTFAEFFRPHGLTDENINRIREFFLQYYSRVEGEMPVSGPIPFTASEVVVRRVYGEHNDVFSYGALCELLLKRLIDAGVVKEGAPGIARFREATSNMTADRRDFRGSAKYQTLRSTLPTAIAAVRAFFS